MSALGVYWERNFVRFEGRVSAAVAVAFAVWLWLNDAACSRVCSLMEGNRAAVYGALAAIFGSLLGFAITALSIAIAFSQDPRLKMVRDSAHYDTMWAVFTKSIQGLSIGTLGALIALVVDRDRAPHPFVVPIVLWTTALGALRTFRTIWVLEKLVNVVKKHKGPVA